MVFKHFKPPRYIDIRYIDHFVSYFVFFYFFMTKIYCPALAVKNIYYEILNHTNIHNCYDNI